MNKVVTLRMPEQFLRKLHMLTLKTLMTWLHYGVNMQRWSYGLSMYIYILLFPMQNFTNFLVHFGGMLIYVIHLFTLLKRNYDKAIDVMGRATVPPRNPNVDFRDEVSCDIVVRNLTL
jgi:hypothetical protein